MRSFVFRAVLAACALAPVLARAQVSVNPEALDSLTPARKPPVHHVAPPRRKPESPPAAEAAPSAAAPQTTQPQTTPPQTTQSQPQPGTQQAHPQTQATLPSVPEAGPPLVDIPPPVAVPTRPPEPPPPIPVIADAPGAAAPIPDGGLRVTFGADNINLNPTTAAAIKSFADKARDSDLPITILAYAPGNQDDPSAPRRLSLSRGLAARAVLLNNGIPSARIYVRALGATPTPDAPPNRVDLALTAATAAQKVATP
jgi:outer membrane protein OmpA-like peptidoglycan-associated protein